MMYVIRCSRDTNEKSCHFELVRGRNAMIVIQVY